MVVGGGIGGLTAAIALGAKGFAVDVIERDPNWSVDGVGIIQQGNVIRAMAQLGLIDAYLGAASGFDHIEICIPTGTVVARLPTPRLVPDLPANVGIGRRALQKVLGDRARDAGAAIHLGVTADAFDDDGTEVSVTLGNGRIARYDVVVGADGLYSQTRTARFRDTPEPAFAGQAVWRYNLRRLPELDALRVFEGTTGVGPVPLSDALMYMFVTTPGPGNPRYPRHGLAAVMRGKLAAIPAPVIRSLAEQIVDAEGTDESHVTRLRQDDANRVDVIAFAAETRADVNALFARVEAAACRMTHAPRALTTLGGGYGFRFFSPDGLPFEVSSDVARGPRRDVTKWEAVPQEISHIVLHSPDH